MSFELKIASRYFLAKKSKNIINWITRISIFVVAIVSAAIIIVLSALNGMNKTVMELYSNFDPDLKITTLHGKTFALNDSLKIKIKHHQNIAHFVESVEETVLLKYDDNQEVAKLKGVSKGFKEMTQIEKMMNPKEDGYFMLSGNGEEFAVLSLQLAMKLGVNTKNEEERINIYLPILEEGTGIQTNYFKNISATPKGTFQINEDFGNYIIVNKDFASELLDNGNKLSSIELGIKDKHKTEETKKEIQQLVGSSLEVKSRFEQNAFLFKTLQSEKWITLFILSVITFLAIFNVIGSLYMLIIDKKKDLFILRSMGATPGQLKRIFWLESCIIGCVGAFLGLALGLSLCFLQQRYGVIEIGSNFSIKAYPIDVQPTDILITFVLVSGINALTSLIPVMAMKDK